MVPAVAAIHQLKSIPKNPMKSRRNLLLGTLVVIALSHSAQATVGTWSGTTTATWDTSATNWTGVTGTPWDVTNGPANTATFYLA